jgi:pyridoxamine 5'-phosphate oxidase
VTDIELAEHLPDALPDNPMEYLERWLGYAMRNEIQRNPNAMTVATVGADGQPSARVVLCKGLVTDPGYLVFYTNYESRKAADIAANDDVAVVFHWDGIGRQVRVEGEATRSPAAESDRYFASRSRGSQTGARGSDQSRPIASRAALIEQIGERSARLGGGRDGDSPVPRPPHWGGIRVWARAVELWIEGADRIHDRARWERHLEPGAADNRIVGRWKATRLQP